MKKNIRLLHCRIEWMSVKRYYGTLVLVLCIIKGFGQTIPKESSFELKTILGTHIYNDQGHLFQDKVYGLDAAYLVNIKQKNVEWVRLTNAKNYGLTFLYRDLKNLKGIQDTSANSFGQVFGLAAQMGFELFSLGKLKFTFTPSIGLAYTNKTFFTHSKNRFIGSHFNETLKADFGVELPFNKNADLLMGIGVLHLSNGGAVIPNGGLNTVNIYAGLKFNRYQGGQEISTQKKQNYSLQKNSIEISAGLGKRGVYEQQKQKLYKSGIYIGYNYYLNELISLKTGIDGVYYDTTYDPQNATQTFQYYATSIDKWRIGVSAGVDANIWKLTFTTQIGKYIHYNRLHEEVNWYWLFGPTYNITPRFGVQAKTYMHFFQADYINYGFVWRL